MIKLNDRISYIEASDEPLSADIGVIKDGERTWLFDVGNGETSIEGLIGPFSVVLSHFHADHTGNIDRIDAGELYVSKETFKHTGRGIVVDADIYLGEMHVFPLPSSHAKGCLGLEVGDTYAFVGDALYCRVKDGCYVYNAQLLKEEIEVLERLQASLLLVSHHKGLVRGKEEVLRELKDIYGIRDKGSPEIRIPIDPAVV